MVKKPGAAKRQSPQVHNAQKTGRDATAPRHAPHSDRHAGKSLSGRDIARQFIRNRCETNEF
jgi:hypothetical protein